MIVFELICASQHRFEGWFASAEDFESQKRRGLLACPDCGDAAVNKLLTAKIRTLNAALDSAPVSPTNAGSPGNANPNMLLHQLIDHVLAHTEDVGERFAEEARRMFHETTPQRGIRGTATREATEELLDEGIPILPLPIPPQGDWH